MITDDDMTVRLLNGRLVCSAGLEKFGAAQPVAERVFHKVAEGTGTSGQRPLLDGGPGVGADVRGELVQTAAARVPAQVPAEDAGCRPGVG